MGLLPPWLRKRLRIPSLAKASEPEMISIYCFFQFPSPPPHDLLSRREYHESIIAQRYYLVPYGQTEDSPLYAMYRIYEHLVLNQNFKLRNELERFWFNRWPIADIPDPEDPEPARYAVLSCIPPLLVESFNERIRVGIHRDCPAIISQDDLEEMWARERVYETAPAWTKKVPALSETLVIPHDDGEVLESMDDRRASPQLKEKNILHWQPHIHFV